MTDPLGLEFVLAGTRTAADVASALCAFLAPATRSIDVAIYDFDARSGASAAVGDALEAAAARGVQVRVAFNTEQPRRASSPRPPKAPPEMIDGLDVPTRAIHGDGTLMHHKYVIRDGQSVWTGSMNWTDDAFSLEENVILRIDSPDLAQAYSKDFEQLWEKERVERTGGDGPPVTVGGVTIQPAFSPKASSLAHLAADIVGTARHRIRILSPVITSGVVLGTLAEFAGRPGFDLVGAYDYTQMHEVQGQWKTNPSNHWKLEAWQVIAPRLSGKRSTPYAPGAVHDYMHAKALMADDEVLTGSYNLSRHGTFNAENVLHIRSGPAAQRFAEFAERVAARYGPDGQVGPPVQAEEGTASPSS